MRWLALLAALVLGGCATDVGPSKAELKAQWDAQNVFPQNYKNDLIAFLRTYINDPTHIRGAAVSQPQLKDVGPGERYIVCVRYDARKDGGQYAGPKDGVATFVSGKLDRYFDVPREVRELCKDAAYGPFPELEKLTR
jgi:hypothetical protein